MLRGPLLCLQQGEKGLQRRGQGLLPVQGGVILPGEAGFPQREGQQGTGGQIPAGQALGEDRHPQPGPAASSRARVLVLSSQGWGVSPADSKTRSTQRAHPAALLSEQQGRGRPAPPGCGEDGAGWGGQRRHVLLEQGEARRWPKR